MRYVTTVGEHEYQIEILDEHHITVDGVQYNIDFEMRILRTLLSVVVAVTAGACTAVRAPDAVDAPRARTQPTSVLLISLDDFRADYFERGLTPRLSQLARQGVRAEWMTTSYPSLTFPNHYSIVTGLRPDRHGIVHNTMRDPVLGSFSLSNREAVGNGAWWGGEPVWVTAEKAGLPTAPFFWPGSEAAIKGVRPGRWKAYDETVPVNDRIDTASPLRYESFTNSMTTRSG